MRKIARTSLVLLAAGLGAGLWYLAMPTAPHQRALQMTVLSPDGLTEARVYSNLWAGALAVNNSAEETVELSERGQRAAVAPSMSDTVMSFDMEGGAVVAVLWQDAGHLVVVTSATTRPNDRPTLLARISSRFLRYDPRNPTDYACIEAFNRVAAAGPVIATPAACSALVGTPA